MFEGLTSRAADPARPRFKRPESGFKGHSAAEGLVSADLLRAVDTVPTIGSRIDIPSEELGFLARFAGLIRAAKAEATLECPRRQPVSGGRSVDVENLSFTFTRNNGEVFPHDYLSYGQKRLLTFLYYLDCNPSIVIADELVNGLHHAWIEKCVEAIGDRQAFLTSQNPLLLDYIAFDSVEQVKETFILCRLEPTAERDRMIWRNMTDDEAVMFYDAYRVGIEHVGEILRARGLW